MQVNMERARHGFTIRLKPVKSNRKLLTGLNSLRLKQKKRSE